MSEEPKESKPPVSRHAVLAVVVITFVIVLGLIGLSLYSCGMK